MLFSASAFAGAGDGTGGEPEQTTSENAKCAYILDGAGDGTGGNPDTTENNVEYTTSEYLSCLIQELFD